MAADTAKNKIEGPIEFNVVNIDCRADGNEVCKYCYYISVWEMLEDGNYIELAGRRDIGSIIAQCGSNLNNSIEYEDPSTSSGDLMLDDKRYMIVGQVVRALNGECPDYDLLQPAGTEQTEVYIDLRWATRHPDLHPVAYAELTSSRISNRIGGYQRCERLLPF